MADKYYKVAVDNWELEEKELHYPNGQEDIKIIPVVGGEGGRGVGRFIVGAVLIGAAIFNFCKFFRIWWIYKGCFRRSISSYSCHIGIALVLRYFRNAYSCSHCLRNRTRS